eukprot:8384044-Prorocentrum_lima.AAC.1
MDDGLAMLANLHAHALRLLCAHGQVHFQGLQQAARKTPSLSPTMRRKLIQLETAYNYMRHISLPLVDE